MLELLRTKLFVNTLRDLGHYDPIDEEINRFFDKNKNFQLVNVDHSSAFVGNYLNAPVVITTIVTYKVIQM